MRGQLVEAQRPVRRQHAGLAHPGADHLADGFLGDPAVVFRVGNDRKINLVGQESLANGHAAVDVGLQHNAGVMDLHHAHQPREPGHCGEFGEADPQSALDNLRLCKLLHRFVALGKKPLCDCKGLLPLLRQSGGA
ncbi:hypothetical protein D9M68_882950 [compost metagenome]